MRRDDSLLLDMLAAARRARRFAEGMTLNPAVEGGLDSQRPL